MVWTCYKEKLIRGSTSGDTDVKENGRKIFNILQELTLLHTGVSKMILLVRTNSVVTKLVMWLAPKT